ncbi:hypothetical protein GW17_00017015 [Ensete ventricosum]|nr:hypothetical protein GW17_00017015 [Ensete ventricosum]
MKLRRRTADLSGENNKGELEGREKDSTPDNILYFFFKIRAPVLHISSSTDGRTERIPSPPHFFFKIRAPVARLLKQRCRRRPPEIDVDGLPTWDAKCGGSKKVTKSFYVSCFTIRAEAHRTMSKADTPEVFRRRCCSSIPQRRLGRSGIDDVALVEVAETPCEHGLCRQCRGRMHTDPMPHSHDFRRERLEKHSPYRFRFMIRAEEHRTDAANRTISKA